MNTLMEILADVFEMLLGPPRDKRARPQADPQPRKPEFDSKR